MPGMDFGTTGGRTGSQKHPHGCRAATVSGVASVFSFTVTPSSLASSASTSVTSWRLALWGGSLAMFNVPPRAASFSSSVTAKPRLARMTAHSKPPGPPPTTTTGRLLPFFWRSCQR